MSILVDDPKWDALKTTSIPITEQITKDSKSGQELHNEDSQNYHISSNEQVGRHLVASKDLIAGDIVLRTLPLATGPLSSSGGPAPCVTCYEILDEDNLYMCPTCGWPVCSEECAAHPRHLPECMAIVASGVKVSFDDPTMWDSLYDCVILLRCLSLRISSPPSWAQMETMESHENTKRLQTHQRRSKALAALFEARFGNSYGSTKADVLRIIATLEVNGMEVSSAGHTLQAIYPIACLAEHACIPSAFRVFGSPDEGFPLTLRAAIDIPMGSAISLTYTDSLWGTPERRTHLYYSKLFLCSCKRCSDREELGACLTALKCRKCGDCILPENPLSEGWLKGAKAEGAEKWSCRNCKERMDGARARTAAWQASEWIKGLEEEDGVEYDAYENVLGKALVRLHPKHSSVIDLKHSILHLLNPPEALNDKQLTKKELLARELLEVAGIIFPGISQLKGTCLYELASSLMEKAKRKQKKEENCQPIIVEAEKSFEDCIYHLHFQSNCQPEYQLLIGAKEKMKDLVKMKANTSAKS
ncbi:SET domain-containing protein SmydA-8-like [Ischnura elegans]|uniref:SET domain-containing protein SmydA-8-like n=1 Tax=Ischnura elegans TaxID=197161 RepID=UPI001ED87F90|nr:SET domain-containing protein SmydA-8-like [Ischnura elegans]